MSQIDFSIMQNLSAHSFTFQPEIRLSKVFPYSHSLFVYAGVIYKYYTVCPTFSRTTLIANSVKSYRPILIFLISEVSLGFCHLFGIHVIDV